MSKVTFLVILLYLICIDLYEFHNLTVCKTKGEKYRYMKIENALEIVLPQCLELLY